MSERDTDSRSGVRFLNDNRSVSEVLGYILIFSLVISTVALVTVLGTPGLENIQESEKASNAERAFDVVGDNMAAIYERDAPSRATEIDLGGSQIYYGSNTTINVTVAGETTSKELRPIKLHISDDSRLVYEGGATIREDNGGAILLDEPPILASKDRVHVPIVKTTAPTIESAGGSTILFRGQSVKRSVEASESSYSGEVKINVTSSRYEVWERYLDEETAFENCSTGDGYVECETVDEPELVFVTVQGIEVSLIL